MGHSANDWDLWDPIDDRGVPCYGDDRWYEDDDERQLFINDLLDRGGFYDEDQL